MTRERASQLAKVNLAMLAFVVFGSFTLATFDRLIGILDHQGPGVVHYGEDGEIAREVSESSYRRHHLITTGLVLALELGVWGAIAAKLRRRWYDCESSSV